jgi:hypothetical protein
LVGCRSLNANGLTGPLPTELGTLDALTYLCVRRPSREQTAVWGSSIDRLRDVDAGRVQRARRGVQQRTCTR